MTKFGNADETEINKFDRISDIWWDPRGEMRTLQTINPLRTRFIMENFPGRAPSVLDVGCGGGILSEALCKLGARVMGIDLSRSSLRVAREHAQSQGLEIDYRYGSIEEISRNYSGSFDAVTCMEMLEHVPAPDQVVAACSRALKPGGRAFFSTINRTPKAFLFAIFGGEYILRLLPRGTHRYSRLIQPRELKNWAKGSGLEFSGLSSLIYNPFTGKFRVVPDREDINYMVHFIKTN